MTDGETGKADYGIDAPGVIRNLAIAGGVCWAVVFGSALGWLPREVVFHPSSGLGIRIPLATAIWPGLGFAVAACGMYFGSRFGKIGEREKLLGRISWRGDERVLDVGCGRGLILVGAALRVQKGRAVGVDVWQARDLSGNLAEVPLRNARREGVADRVAVQTADMRRLPFRDGAFDVVVSRAAIHNLYKPEFRAAAIREIGRVLRPGGQAVIADIRHHAQYARAFAEVGCRDTRLLDSKLLSLFYAVFTMGSLRPNTLLATKERTGGS